ncbi:MAG: glycosyltransferase family 2 protein [Bryobacteraceae bacterium]|nr:glycosyltransferase family 2 protein [Bryobacteraceae bacterium]MDW8380368.1 glycosyltransferase family 2 protein [Bryobacterales bacterium]
MHSLSIIVPAYNEEQRLPPTLTQLLSWASQRSWKWFEILVVDDGSRDRTAEVVRRFAQQHPCIRLVSNPGNRGKGYAVRHGMLCAQGDWRLFTDSDLSTPIEEFDKLMQAAARAQADVAFGSRALDRSLVSVHQPAFREASGRFFNFVMRLIMRLPHRDTQCGFKLYSAAAAKEIFSRQQIDGFGFDVEDLFLARKLGFVAVEVPVRWANVEGTRVSLASGLRAFGELFLIRWNQLRGRYR